MNTNACVLQEQRIADLTYMPIIQSLRVQHPDVTEEKRGGG